MRIIKTSSYNNITITYFEVNLKFIIKFESFGMEQTYKVDKLEFLNFSDLEDKIDINFLGSIESRFDDMSSELKKLYN
ncbi:MAG: hypothetical protein CMB87_04695 [Flammeovirgaceae bacterium]|nr:hypothetical protein [Flammeovirgaceae bacterium]PDH50762.1 MAG: hypothetical protein CND58_00105 [Rhodothermaeota bacterium MED-G16]|tara:strand:+ start:585 stop:818 length:234 start_codon:yes stop_codon:yes gene_type:complete